MHGTMLKNTQFWILLGLVGLAVFMVAEPSSAVTSAAYGLKLWATVVVPALLPFFIVAELLVSMGLVKFLGVLLEPVMQPIFRLPGCSSLVIAMGFTSGFPVGALLTRRLYDQAMLSAEQAERLVSFTNNSSPLFILGAVGMGMFGSPKLGWLLAISHYLANLTVGLLYRFKARAVPGAVKLGRRERWRNAVMELLLAMNQEGLSKRLATAISTGITNILAIGGYIITFSVITSMLSDWGFMEILARSIRSLLGFFDLSYQVAYGLGMGLFEITLGSNFIAQASDATLLHQLLAVSAVLSFSGLCIITQVMGVMVGTPVRLGFYLKARLLQCAISVAITMIGYKYWVAASSPVSNPVLLPSPFYTIPAWHWSLYCMALFALLVGVLLCIAWLKND